MPGVGGGDEVWYNSGDGNYYVTAGNDPVGPVFGVIGSVVNTLTQLVPTLPPGSGGIDWDEQTQRRDRALNSRERHRQPGLRAVAGEHQLPELRARLCRGIRRAVTGALAAFLGQASRVVYHC